MPSGTKHEIFARIELCHLCERLYWGITDGWKERGFVSTWVLLALSSADHFAELNVECFNFPCRTGVNIHTPINRTQKKTIVETERSAATTTTRGRAPSSWRNSAAKVILQSTIASGFDCDARRDWLPAEKVYLMDERFVLYPFKHFKVNLANLRGAAYKSLDATTRDYYAK